LRLLVVVAAACLYLSRAQPAHLHVRYTVTKIIYSSRSDKYILRITSWSH
jgi:hypothetical protein